MQRLSLTPSALHTWPLLSSVLRTHPPSLAPSRSPPRLYPRDVPSFVTTNTYIQCVLCLLQNPQDSATCSEPPCGAENQPTSLIGFRQLAPTAWAKGSRQTNLPCISWTHPSVAELPPTAVAGTGHFALLTTAWYCLYQLRTKLLRRITYAHFQTYLCKHMFASYRRPRRARLYVYLSWSKTDPLGKA